MESATTGEQSSMLGLNKNQSSAPSAVHSILDKGPSTSRMDGRGLGWISGNRIDFYLFTMRSGRSRILIRG